MTALPSAADPPVIRTRRVHYISGFDPRGAAHYHRLYRDEAAKQLAWLDASGIEVGDRRRVDRRQSRWPVVGRWKDRRVDTDYRFMAWDDIVRKHWERSRTRLLTRVLRNYPAYFATGGLARARTTSRGAYYTGMLPLAYQSLMLLTVLLALLLGWGLGTLAGAPTAGLVAGVVLASGSVFGGLRLADRIGLFWLIRIWQFVFDWGTRGIPGLEERIREIADAIVTAQRQEPVDEVLIVGHSIGSIIAVAVAARLLDENGKLPDFLAQRTALMTLGQCIPWLTCMPGAASFRADLEHLARSDALPWLDVSGPTDPLGYFNVDPVAEAGISGAPAAHPLLVTARFFRMFHRDTYTRLRRNKLRLHFQYLMASELPADYDYFGITAGSEPALQPFFARASR